MEWHARHPRDSKSSFPCAALPGFCLGNGSFSPDCQMYAEIACICSSFNRKFGIFVVGRKSVGFFSQTGIQFLFSFSRTSFKFGPIFFMSCIKLCD